MRWSISAIIASTALVDLLVLAREREQLGDERLDAALGDLVGVLVVGLHVGLDEQLLEQRATARRRHGVAAFALRASMISLLSSPCVQAALVNDELRHALARPASAKMAGSSCGSLRSISERALECRQRVAQLEQLLQLRHLMGDASGLKSPRRLNLGSPRARAWPSSDSLSFTARVRLGPMLPITSVKLSLSTLIGLRFSISRLVLLAGEAAHHQHLERQLDLFLAGRSCCGRRC